MKINKIIIIFHTILCATITAKSVAKDEEVEVKLQFLEYELEDFCMSKNEAEWKFLNGSEPDLKKLLELELKESDFYKNELETLQKHIGKKFENKRLQRLMDIFSHPGAPLLGSMEFKEYRDYSVKLQELIGKIKIDLHENNENTSTTGDASINYRGMNTFLYNEKSERKLKDAWIRWYKELEERNKKTKYDFVQQLSILDLEAEQNGEEELTEYWLKQSDISSINYETAKNLWKEIQPLYEKLKQYLLSLITKQYGENVLHNKKVIPVHLLGSLETQDWIRAVEKLGGFDHSDSYKAITSTLKQKTFQDLYRMADNLSADLKLGYLPQKFFEKSRFNESSQVCQNKVTNHCERENVFRVMMCSNEDIDIKLYITINENVMRMKHLLLSGKEEEENGYLFREGPRESVLHEALGSFSTLRALWPESLESQKLLTNQTQQKQEILSLFITALHVIPSLPYQLAGDLWRINALQEIDAAVGENTADTTVPSFSSTNSDHEIDKREILRETEDSADANSNGKNETMVEEGPNRNVSGDATDGVKIYDTRNLTKDWWSYREKLQGVGSPDGKLYEDYLQDGYIIWNKPYISKFLGSILQFQILEHLRNENLTADTISFQTLMQKGKSKPWQLLIEETFNITDISAKSLLRYFKPLEEYLDKKISSKSQGNIFNFDDFNFISQGFSLNPVNEDEEGEKPAEGSDALFFSLAVIAAVSLVAIIVTVGRRRYKKRQRARERKRRLAEYNRLILTPSSTISVENIKKK